MPAKKPTAESILRFFALSGKKHLLLTGGRGVGKSTLFAQLLPLLSQSCLLSDKATSVFPADIHTRAVPGEGVYLQCVNKVLQIGSFDVSLPGTENKMRPNRQALEAAAGCLERLALSSKDWIAIDEIGYLESDCAEYCQALRQLFHTKHVLAVLRKQKLPFLEELKSRSDVCVIDLDRPFGKTGCVIMASGLGKRFHGGNKLLAMFRGKPLIQWMLDATANLFEKRVVVTRHPEIVTLCHQQNIPCILHTLPYRSDTIRLGIEALEQEVDSCVFCPGDQPLLTRETLETMLLSASLFPNHMLQLSFSDQKGTPVFFPRSLFTELKSLPEGRGGNFLLKKYPEQVRAVPARDIYELQDIDTPEDLEAITQRPSP